MVRDVWERGTGWGGRCAGEDERCSVPVDTVYSTMMTTCSLYCDMTRRIQAAVD